MSPSNCDYSDLVVGVLELQGDFAEHTAMLRACGVGQVVGIRELSDLTGLDAVVFPGGESTVMSKLLVEQNMMSKLQTMAKKDTPMFGTCAGCILLSSDIQQRPKQARIGAVDICVDRNAYGPQIYSFETMVQTDFPAFAEGPPLRVVQIRAPAIVSTGPEVETLASYEGQPILVRQCSKLVCTFHPELTEDTRVHALFLEMVLEKKRYSS